MKVGQVWDSLGIGYRVVKVNTFKGHLSASVNAIKSDASKCLFWAVEYPFSPQHPSWTLIEDVP